MFDGSNEAATRARWLAEVSEALDEAQRLTARLAQTSSGSSEAVLMRITAVRTEVEALQRSRSAPKWSKRAVPRPDQTP